MGEGDIIWPGGVNVPHYACRYIDCNLGEQFQPVYNVILNYTVMLSATKHLSPSREMLRFAQDGTRMGLPV